MSVPIAHPIARAAALYGAANRVGGAIDHDNAKDINENAHSMVDDASRQIEKEREVTDAVLKDYGEHKLRAFKDVIADFIDTFVRLKNVDTIHTRRCWYVSVHQCHQCWARLEG